MCGANLFYRLTKSGLTNSGTYEMCVGAFDEKEIFTMSGEIFIDKKPPGYSMAGDHPRLTEAEVLAKYRDGSD